jgi:Bacteriocin-protection, YdeI or OmpD-Associated/Domain of unknown function (DUF1905)
VKFRAHVEPPEPMKGLEVPPAVVHALGGGARPRVLVTINGHTWSTRIAIMRGRHLIGLSIANRTSAGVATGEEVLVHVKLDTEPIKVVEPADLTAALDSHPVARKAFDQLTVSQRKQHVRVIENAKRPETRARRIHDLLSSLRASKG